MARGKGIGIVKIFWTLTRHTQHGLRLQD